MAYSLVWNGNTGTNVLSGYNNFRFEKTVTLNYDTAPTESIRATVYMRRTSSTTGMEVAHIYLEESLEWEATLVVDYAYGWKDFFDNVYGGGWAKVSAEIDGTTYTTDEAYFSINKGPILADVKHTSDLSDSSVFIEGISHSTIRFKQVPQLGTTEATPTIKHRGESVTPIRRGEGWEGTFTNTDTTAPDYITIVTRDSDGNISNESVWYDPLKHSAPTIDYNVYRCDSNGDRDMDGGYLSVTAWANANPSVLSITELGVYCVSDSGTVIIDDGDDGWYELTNGTRYILGGGQVDPEMGYSITFRAVDNYGSDIQSADYISPVQRIINVKEGGTGIAFGKRATEDNVIGKPDDWKWEGINEDFDSTSGYSSATGTSGTIVVKTWNITKAGVYLVAATSYQTVSGYSSANRATMRSVLSIRRSGATAESYLQGAPLTGDSSSGGDNSLTAMFNCSAGDTIQCRVQQQVGSSSATLTSQTFYVKSSIIRLA